MENSDEKIEKGRLVGKIYTHIGKALMMASIPFYFYGFICLSKISEEELNKNNIIAIMEDYNKAFENIENVRKFDKSYCGGFFLSLLGASFYGVGCRKRIYGNYWGT